MAQKKTLFLFSLSIITIYTINRLKKSKQNAPTVQTPIAPKLISFLPPKKKYQYKYTGNIDTLRYKLISKSISIEPSMIDYILLCTKENIRFEIRIIKYEDFYLVSFTHLEGDEKEFVNLLKSLFI